MFASRRRVVQVAGEAVESVSPYVDRFAHDERFRRRLIAAMVAAAAAQRRARRQAGWIGLATRLSSDPVLRAQVTQAVEQLQKAKSRKSRRKHTMRNTTLILGGATLAVAAVPDLRDPLISRARRLYRRTWDSSGTPTTATIVEDIEVAAPVSVVYNQWTSSRSSRPLWRASMRSNSSMTRSSTGPHRSPGRRQSGMPRSSSRNPTSASPGNRSTA